MRGSAALRLGGLLNRKLGGKAGAAAFPIYDAGEEWKRGVARFVKGVDGEEF